jgi:hypothetical protein
MYTLKGFVCKHLLLVLLTVSSVAAEEKGKLSNPVKCEEEIYSHSQQTVLNCTVQCVSPNSVLYCRVQCVSYDCILTSSSHFSRIGQLSFS